MTTNEMVKKVKSVVGDINENIIIDKIVDYDGQGISDENIVAYIIDDINNQE